MFIVTDIEPYVLYVVAGNQSVTYSGVTYNTSQTFRGVIGVTGFTYSGSGSQLVYEVTELKGGDVLFEHNATDLPAFADTTKIIGFSIEFDLNPDEEHVTDVTRISGFAVEVENYPFYGFEIIERRW